MNLRLTLVTTSAAMLAVAAFATAQVPTPSVPVAPVIASAAPLARVAPVASVSPVTGVGPIALPVAQVAPVASVGALAAAEAPQAPSAQSPKVVATTPQPTPKVVRPTIATAPRATVRPVADDPQAAPAPPAPPQAPAAAQAPRAATAPEPPTPAPAIRRPRGQLVNLRLEFTITDQMGTATPVKKTVTMNVADGESGRIRTNADVPRKTGTSAGSWTFMSVPLSIDASPEVEGNKIRLRASLDYQLLSDAPSADLPGGKTSISQMVTSILNDGVSAILSQSADPLTDRKVTLEVKATIVK